jgi:hypothetical protein
MLLPWKVTYFPSISKPPISPIDKIIKNMYNAYVMNNFKNIDYIKSALLITNKGAENG